MLRHKVSLQGSKPDPPRRMTCKAYALKEVVLFIRNVIIIVGSRATRNTLLFVVAVCRIEHTSILSVNRVPPLTYINNKARLAAGGPVRWCRPTCSI